MEEAETGQQGAAGCTPVHTNVIDVGASKRVCQAGLLFRGQ